jgi:hypothetical protein
LPHLCGPRRKGNVGETCGSIRGNNACRHWCQDISGGILFERRAGVRGKYELRPAVKKLCQLRPDVSASSVSVVSRVVNPKHDELRPAVSKELY